MLLDVGKAKPRDQVARAPCLQCANNHCPHQKERLARPRTTIKQDMSGIRTQQPRCNDLSSLERPGAVDDAGPCFPIDHRFASSGETEITSIAVEMGTLPSDQVLQSLVADNWLHLRGDPASDRGREIKAQIREAFFPDKPDWNRPAYGRGTEIMSQALEGLTCPL